MIDLPFERCHLGPGDFNKCSLDGQLQLKLGKITHQLSLHFGGTKAWRAGQCQYNLTRRPFWGQKQQKANSITSNRSLTFFISIWQYVKNVAWATCHSRLRKKKTWKNPPWRFNSEFTPGKMMGLENGSGFLIGFRSPLALRMVPYQSLTTGLRRQGVSFGVVKKHRKHTNIPPPTHHGSKNMGSWLILWINSHIWMNLVYIYRTVYHICFKCIVLSITKYFCIYEYLDMLIAKDEHAQTHVYIPT